MTEEYDSKTDRFYCQECLEPTVRVQLRQLEEEMNNLFGGDISVNDDDLGSTDPLDETETGFSDGDSLSNIPTGGSSVLDDREVED